MLELNKVMLTGNLTRDPEVRYIPSGKAVADLRLAVNRRTFDRGSGERREETMFIDVTAWEKTAEFCKNYMHKGSGIYVEGRLRMDTWEDKQGGGTRSKILVVAERIQFVESKSTSGGSGGGYAGDADSGDRPARTSASGRGGDSRDDDYDAGNDTKDDLPF